jgi:PQQ-dependent dehydrogenase (methanol/ethanol family)
MYLKAKTHSPGTVPCGMDTAARALPLGSRLTCNQSRPRTGGMIASALLLLLFPMQLLPQQPSPQQLFQKNCSSCHGDDARGTGQGPRLAANPQVAAQSAAQLRTFLEHGDTAAGMPSFADLPEADLDALTGFLRSINTGTPSGPVASAEPSRKITWGPPQPGDWLSYNGNDSANRYSPLNQITTANISGLRLKWVFPIDYFGLETTPLAADGVLYVTGPNQVFALDALTGESIWHYSRAATSGLVGDGKLGTNRGVAILNDKVFFDTDNAHLLALDRATGKLVWETTVAPPDIPQPYVGTMAPLIVDNMIIVGVTGADHGIRGFVAAFKPEDGSVVWRHWTIPKAGESGIETWIGKEPVDGGGSTWIPGSYDPSSDTLYWATGNPYPDGIDTNRGGDNLYTDSVLALNPRTGDVKWYYQFTPHDLRDRDATEPNVLVDTVYKGSPAKILLHADRNGFFYVLDRTTGEVLLAKSFLRRDDWASSIGPGGRPVVTDPRGCPSDAANWASTAFSPETKLYYFMALEECTGAPAVRHRAGAAAETDHPEWTGENQRELMGRQNDQPGQHFLRAVNIETGAIAWEVPQPGIAHAKTWGGVLATAGGLVFYGGPNGGFSAVDQKDGKTLWQFSTNARMKASPITFTVAGKQFIAVAAGPNILCFGL